MQEEVTPNYRGLKILVSVLGVVILIMLGLVAVGVALRLSSDEQSSEPPWADDPIIGELSVPPNSKIVAIRPAQGGVYLHVRDGADIDHLYFLDRESGALLWHRRLQPGG